MKLKLNLRSALQGFGFAVVSVAGTSAYNVGDYLTLNGGTYVTEGSYLDTSSAAVQNSTLVTERRVATVATEAQTNMVLSQISDRLSSVSAPAAASVNLLPATGGNAGSSDNRGSVWARAGYDHLKEDRINSFGGWDANLWTIALGYDYKVNDKFLAGAALTYSNLKGDTKFNRGNIKDDAYGIIPYAAFKINPCFDIDLMVGYSRVNKKRNRSTPQVNGAAFAGTRAHSSPKSDRWFGSVFANYKQHVNQWNLLARLGYTYVTDKQKAYTESNGQVNQTTYAVENRQYGSLDTNLSRLSLRLQAGYKANNAVEPYAFLIYARDFGASKMKVQDTATANNVGVSMISPNGQRKGNNTYGGGLGLNGNLGNNWTTGIEAGYAKSDKKFKVFSGALRLRKAF